MRIRSAKRLAQRIDLYYFKHASPLRRWRTILSIGAPVVGLLWLGGMAAAGSRAPFSSGPVSTAHAFAEAKCQVCHVRDTRFRAHVSDKACLTCHDAPAHAGGKEPAPTCATCHREHNGRVALARTSDGFCVRCHGNSSSPSGSGTRDAGSGMRPAAPGVRQVATTVKAFPAGHPEFAASQPAAQDRGTLKFNHQVHLKKDLRGPKGPEQLDCGECHTPRLASARRSAAPLMSSYAYEQQCARCHPLFFDERLDVQAPHKQTSEVHAFIEQALRDYIAAHPSEIFKPDPAPRRVPLNFPRVGETPPRTAGEWVAKHLFRSEQVLWKGSCSACHASYGHVDGPKYSGPYIDMGRPVRWMPKATFDHRPHLMVECTSCHDAKQSTAINDGLMPKKGICATCHAPEKGAESRCFECHAYHEWVKERAVAPHFRATDFR